MAIIPTKSNLMAAKRSLALARVGWDLMDRKRNILVREMMILIDRAKEIQSQIDGTFSSAYASLQLANITLGTCGDIAQAVPVDDSVTIHYRSVMGVELPTVKVGGAPPKLEYGFTETNSMLDDAYRKFHQVKRLTQQLAEVEISVYRLAHAIKKTQKRANALKNIIIPTQEYTARVIIDALEEKEREEFSRLKVIKKQKRA